MMERSRTHTGTDSSIMIECETCVGDGESCTVLSGRIEVKPSDALR
jgi:hypothetical protein